MEIIDKYKFILTLSNETELSVDEVTELINKIPFKYLEMVVNEYKNNGLLNLKMFVEDLKFLCKWRKEKVRIEVSSNFSIVCIYKDCQLVSIIDLDKSVIEVAKELTDLFTVLDIDCEVVEID